MPKPVVIETKRLLLRPYRLTDTESVLVFRSDPEIARYQLWEPFTLSKLHLFIHIYKIVPFGTPGRWTGLVIQSKFNGKVMGDLALRVSRDIKPQAEIGYNVAKKYQRQGYGTESIHAVVDWIFKNTQIHRITATCDTRNKASVALLQKLGFRREAHFVKNLWSKGHWRDEYIYAVLKEEWKS